MEKCSVNIRYRLNDRRAAIFLLDALKIKFPAVATLHSGLDGFELKITTFLLEIFLLRNDSKMHKKHIHIIGNSRKYLLIRTADQVLHESLL